MTDIINPYIAGNPVTTAEMFFGREDVFEFVRRTLIGRHRDNVIVLYGQRRTGKTSVLYQMRYHLDPRYLCIFIDLHGLALEGLGGLLWELANQISRVLRRDYQIDLPSLERTEFMIDPRTALESEFLNLVWSSIGDCHILLMLDEAVRLLEQVQAGKLEPGVFEYMRHLMQHHERLNFLFSLGSGLEEMEKEYSFLFSVGLYKRISFLERNATYALITQPAKDYYHVEPAALERIFQVTSGHPYFTQLLCHSLFNYWQQKCDPYVEVRSVDAILDEVVERGLAVLKHVWDESTAGEKAIMAGMASAGIRSGLIGVNTINRAWKRYGIAIPKGEMALAMRSLTARDVVEGQGSYRFKVDLQCMWVQKYRRIEWVKEEIADTVRGWPSNVTANPSITISRRKFLVGGLGLGVVTGGTIYIFASGAYRFIGREWQDFGYWLRALHSPPENHFTYRGHTDAVNSIVWSPDGLRIASGGFDATVQVWDALTGGHVLIYRGHVQNNNNTGVNTVAWSPNGRYIASGGGDVTVQVWDALTGAHFFTYLGHAQNNYVVDTVAWSPDSQRIASGGFDATVQVWDALTGEKDITYLGNKFGVTAVAWSPDGKYIASGDSDRAVYLWDAHTSKNLLSYFGHSSTVTAVAWSPDGKYIASGSYDTTVQVWRAI